ncbi:MAG: hypothetical protein HUJ42_01725 [Malacoplasma sp.]|nr:hypothetical protein [Malacoplasma sp.]
MKKTLKKSRNAKKSKIFCFQIDKKYEVDFRNKNFRNYSKAVCLNKHNQRLFKKLVLWKIFYYFVCFLLIASSVFEMALHLKFSLPELNAIIWVGVNAAIFFIIYIPWLLRIIFAFNRYSFYQGERSNFFINEFLKCKYEFLTSTALSKQRIFEITKFFNPFYFKYRISSKLSLVRKNKVKTNSIKIDAIIQKNKVLFFIFDFLIYLSWVFFICSLIVVFIF